MAFASTVAKVAPKLPAKGPEAYTNHGDVDLPPCEMINPNSKVKLGRKIEHTLQSP
jgi:hypothetical protein